jgi:hypothetical protein
MGVSSAQSLAFIVFVATVTQRISLVAPDSSNHDKENVMTRLTRMFSLVLATSMLVLSAYSEAATIRYDVTNATSVQNGYSLSGYFEVSGTGNVGGFSSFSLTATKADNTTITISTGANTELTGNVIATDSALYLPDGVYLSFYTSDYSQYLTWDNNYQSVLYYSTKNIDGDLGWEGPFGGICGIVGEGAAGEVEGLAVGVEEFDPVGAVAVFVGDAVGVAGDDFGDVRSGGACWGGCRAQECGGRQQDGHGAIHAERQRKGNGVGASMLGLFMGFS